MWWNDYADGCCDGGWAIGESDDGLSFRIVARNVTGQYPQVDGNALFVDDDDAHTAYIVYSSIAEGHRVSVERLTPDYRGTTKQSSDLSNMIWSVAEIVAHLSRYFRLEPGDLVFTGTPDGVGPMVAGDVVEAGVEGVGRLRVRHPAPGLRRRGGP